jgi:hypothetical protein
MTTFLFVDRICTSKIYNTHLHICRTNNLFVYTDAKKDAKILPLFAKQYCSATYDTARGNIIHLPCCCFASCLCRCCLRCCCHCPVAAVATVALPPPLPLLPQLPPLSLSSSAAFHHRLLPSPSHVVDCCLFVLNRSSYPAPSSLLPPPARLANVVNCRTKDHRWRSSLSSPAIFSLPPSFFGRPSIIVRLTRPRRGTTATRRHR